MLFDMLFYKELKMLYIIILKSDKEYKFCFGLVEYLLYKFCC